MPAHTPRPAYHHWRDIEDIPIPDRCRIEQVTVHKEPGALPSRLRTQGQILGRSSTRLRVRFDDETRLIPLRPHRVRVLETPSHPCAPDTTRLPGTGVSSPEANTPHPGWR
jgi:hypothetical protein